MVFAFSKHLFISAQARSALFPCVLRPCISLREELFICQQVAGFFQQPWLNELFWLSALIQQKLSVLVDQFFCAIA